MNIVKIILPLTAIFSWNIQQYNVKNVFLHGDLINGVYMYYPPSIEVAHSSKGIFISQRKYVADLLKDTEKSACKPAITPLNPNHKLSVREGEYIDCKMYQQLIGRLLYLTHTRHEISYSTKSHLHVVYQVLHYLKGTPRKGILFKCGGNLTIEVYIDANYVSSPLNCRSPSVKKQNVVARSSAESTFRAFEHRICELLWVKILLINLKDSYFLSYESKEICIPYISAQHQLLDLLTKGVSKTQLEQMLSNPGIDDIHSPA
ncbi:unnamed protein product [Spirodela intermedia]|uniref:Uncharacterized protein n=1 Tax=Spirodela intermedia TaxID=51605 RepID=A0A7I8KT32_SPIIN|nr:unnamed protein product [Spirodela intermedia]